MKEGANDKRILLIAEILNLSDDQTLSAFIGTTSKPDATTQSHGGGHPPNPPPDPPPGEGD